MADAVLFDPTLHQYRNEEGRIFPSVTEVIRGSGKFFYRNAQESIERGTKVHKMLEKYDLGSSRCPAALRPYKNAYRDWKRSVEFVPLVVERPFISPYGYAGTVDRTGYIGPKLEQCVLDLKTGVAVPEWCRLQLVAYGMHAFGRPVRRIALRLSPEGKAYVKEYPLSSFLVDWAEFMELLRRHRAA